MGGVSPMFLASTCAVNRGGISLSLDGTTGERAGRDGADSVVPVSHGVPFRAGRVYLAVADHHLLVDETVSAPRRLRPARGGRAAVGSDRRRRDGRDRRQGRRRPRAGAGSRRCDELAGMLARVARGEPLGER
jgi:hypothetical protein